MDERFVDDERGVLEARFDVTDIPTVRGVAEGQPSCLDFFPVLFRPLERPHLGADKHVAFHAGVRPARAKALKRIDAERQRFQIEHDFLDRFGGRQLVDGRHREDGLALVDGLVRESQFGLDVRLRGCCRRPTAAARPLLFRGGGAAGGRSHNRHVVGGEDGVHARHFEGLARVDVAHSRMRHRTEEQLHEQHPVGAVVLRVFRSTRDLGDDVGRLIVVSDQLVIGHRQVLRMFSAPRIIEFRILL